MYPTPKLSLLSRVYFNWIIWVFSTQSVDDTRANWASHLLLTIIIHQILFVKICEDSLTHHLTKQINTFLILKWKKYVIFLKLDEYLQGLKAKLIKIDNSVYEMKHTR